MKMIRFPLCFTLLLSACSPVPYWSSQQDVSPIVSGNAPADIKGCIIQFFNGEGVAVEMIHFSRGSSQKFYYPKFDWDFAPGLGLFSGVENCRYYVKISEQVAQVVTTTEQVWPLADIADGCGSNGYTLYFDSDLGGHYQETLDTPWVVKEAKHEVKGRVKQGRFTIQKR